MNLSTGGLLPGQIYLVEFANYTKITYSKEVAKGPFHTYFLNNLKCLGTFDLCLN